MMGVMECDRPGCDNIMCTHTVLGNYYLCNECMSELDVFKFSLVNVRDEEEAVSSLKFFMQTMKGYYSEAKIDPIVDEVFRREIRVI